MKKLVLLLTVICTTAAADGQSVRRFSFATDFGTGIDLSEPASTPFLWRVAASCHIGSRFSVGAGTGLSFYEKTLIPVFADVRLLLTRSRRFTPYLQCGAGYAFAPDGEANGGFQLAPVVGVQYALPGGVHLFLSAGYERQTLERLKKFACDSFTAHFRERLFHHAVTLRMGLRF